MTLRAGGNEPSANILIIIIEVVIILLIIIIIIIIIDHHHLLNNKLKVDPVSVVKNVYDLYLWKILRH